jgi:hypothetical protein
VKQIGKEAPNYEEEMENELTMLLSLVFFTPDMTCEKRLKKVQNL